jgi:hypothetical protein
LFVPSIRPFVLNECQGVAKVNISVSLHQI